jgi:hypothetical protein
MRVERLGWAAAGLIGAVVLAASAVVRPDRASTRFARFAMVVTQTPPPPAAI